MSKQQNSINEPLIHIHEEGLTSEQNLEKDRRPAAKRSVKVNMSVHSVDDFIAEIIVQRFYILIFLWFGVLHFCLNFSIIGFLFLFVWESLIFFKILFFALVSMYPKSAKERENEEEVEVVDVVPTENESQQSKFPKFISILINFHQRISL
jgi:hypothetical protein